VSLTAASVAVVIAVLLGVPLGVVAGFLGGKPDRVINAVNDAVMTFPPILLAVVIAGILGPSLVNAMVSVGIVYAPRFLRVSRGAVVQVAQEPFVAGARVVGCSQKRILWRHIAPSALAPIVVQTSLALGLAILAEAGLSFLGLGVQLPTPSWGGMLGTMFPHIERLPVGVLAVGGTISAAVLSFNVLGDVLRDAGVRTESRM
jgi:ABC-type dipeptide/oligopeptide/nickel transport system permease subunit